MAGNHWNRFGDIRRVCLSNPELRTLSAARTRFAKYSYCSSHPETCCRFPALNSGCRRGCRAGHHRNRSREIRRVRLSHAEV
eukprot:2722616-Pyramimonas_sp.AAC.1